MTKIAPFFENPDKISREELLEQISWFYPSGSGPLSMMRMICGLMLNICSLRGFEPITEQEILKYRESEWQKKKTQA